jgi:5-oxoprolinase (ATP-hydrolysing) subunit A
LAKAFALRAWRGYTDLKTVVDPMRIDINSDLGESFGAYAIGHDAGLMHAITSANIAAGFHAGDPSVLRDTIRLAKAHGVAVGAHPGFPDLVGFGRRELHVTAREAEDFVLYQVAAVMGVAAAEGATVQHVKPHGALFNMAVRDADLASAIARAVAAIDRSLILFGLPGSEILRAGRAAGLRVAAEVFADRAYEPDGSLMSRRKPGAVIHDTAAVVARAVKMITERSVIASDGSVVPLDADTICVHGDTPGSDALAASLRDALERAGVVVKAIGAA